MSLRDTESYRRWSAAWRRGETPWMHPKGDAFLMRILASLRTRGVPKGAKVLVPLVGSSPVIKRLHRRGYDVTGVEYVPKALAELRARFPELSFVKRRDPRGPVYTARRLALHEWDFLTFSARGEYPLIYDRAAMVAIDPRDRMRYSKILKDALAPGGLLVLVTIEYVMQARASAKELGPPFGLTPREVRSLYRGLRCVDRFEAQDCAPPPRFTDAGVRKIRYTAWCLRKPAVKRGGASKKTQRS